MRGLVAYDEDSQSDSDYPSNVASGSTKPESANKLHDGTFNAGANRTKESSSRRTSGQPKAETPPLIIRRPIHAHTKTHTRVHVTENADEVDTDCNQNLSQVPSPSDNHALQTLDDGGLARIRTLLRPPPVAGLTDWGVPPEPAEPCDSAVEAKLVHFHTLKNDPSDPRHFNDSLMSNRSFRNPHLYAKLVEFVDVDEKTTNFPKDIWDPNDVQEEWFADKIGTLSNYIIAYERARHA